MDLYKVSAIVTVVLPVGQGNDPYFSRPSEEAFVNVDGPFPNFAVLSRIRKTLEMVRSPVDSPLYPLATNFFIRSPWAH